MVWVGITLLVAAIAGTGISSYWFGDSAMIRYVQTGFFLLGAAGIFLIERKSLKRKAENRKKKIDK